MFKKLLVAVDASEASDHAVEAARDLALATGAHVVLFHVREVLPPIGRAAALAPEVPEAAAAFVDAFGEPLESAGVPVEGEIRTSEVGAVAREIVSAAARHGCDLVVMGSHRPSAVGHLVLGSNAYRVLHTCHLPILVVR